MPSFLFFCLDCVKFMRLLSGLQHICDLARHCTLISIQSALGVERVIAALLMSFGRLTLRSFGKLTLKSFGRLVEGRNVRAP